MGSLVNEFEQQGYAVLPSVFPRPAIAAMVEVINAAMVAEATHEQSPTLFAIRKVLEVVPGLRPLVLTEEMRAMVAEFAPAGAYLTKSIYFDKPQASNWFVAWHQDISISAKAKVAANGYSQWTQKGDIIGVVPPVEVLENTLTVRIHLDDTDADNGGLQVVTGSHRWGIVRKETLDLQQFNTATPFVPAGGVMLMRPLTLHASRRAISGGRRRVIHLEFSHLALPNGVDWAEKMVL